LVEKTKIAVVGAGYWGSKLVNEYQALSKKRPDVRLCAVVDGSSAVLRKIGDRFSLPDSMLKENYDDVLSDPEVVGVHIATPNETHYDFAMKAINAGKHVLLEKPMCLTSSDAFRLARTAEKSNLVLLIGHIFRFNNALNKIKEMVEQKELVDLRCLELRWASALPPPSNRDILFDLAPHPIDILNLLLEEWPTEVYVKARSYERRTVGQEEVAYITLDFPEDIMATVTLSWLHYGHRERTVNIISKDRSVKIEAVNQKVTMFENGEAKEIPIEKNNTIESEITHFVNCIGKDDPPINSALTGIMNVTVLEAMARSLKEDKVTQIIGR
jgi:UDP-N-acetylglucosamine 3-dehydrogenase